MGSPLATARRAPRQVEAGQQEQGIALLRSMGAKVYRLGVRRRKGDHPGTGMSEGLPDVLAFVPHRGSGVRTFVAWECKAPGGRMRPEQIAFATQCFDAGVAHVTGDLTALMQWLVGAGFLRADQLPASRRPATEARSIRAALAAARALLARAMSDQCRVGRSMSSDYYEHSAECDECKAHEQVLTQRANEAVEDATWVGAVVYVREMAAAILNMRNAFIADPGMAEMAVIRAETLKMCADGMERAAVLARGAKTP